LIDLDTKLRVPGEFDVITYRAPDFIGDYSQMDYGDPADPRVVQLREEFDFDEAVGGYDTELEAQLALKRWVRGQWDHGFSHSFDTVKDALDILHEVAKGEQFCCGHYTQVFVACATALGWPARPVGISIADPGFRRDHHRCNVGHSVPEIWSNELAKWIVLDPDLNLHYEREGTPLSALEVHDAWLSRGADSVTVVQEQPEFVPVNERSIQVAREMPWGVPDYDEETSRLNVARFTRHNVMDYYARVRINGWEWVDGRCLPTFVNNFQPSGGHTWTSSTDDMYWAVNMVRLSTRPSWEDGAKVAVTLEHCMPWFDHFEARIDEGDWKRVEEAFDWPMNEGANVLECRAVNVQGRPGIPSRIEVGYAKARW